MKTWIEINNDSRAMCNNNGHIKLINLLLKSSLSAYTYILIKGTITAALRTTDRENKQEIIS